MKRLDYQAHCGFGRIVALTGGGGVYTVHLRTFKDDKPVWETLYNGIEYDEAIHQYLDRQRVYLEGEV